MMETTTNIMVVSPEIDLSIRLNSIFKNKDTNILWEPDPHKIIGHCRIDTFDIMIITSSAIVKSKSEIINTLATISEKCSITKMLLLIDPHDLTLITNTLDISIYQYYKLPVSDQELILLISSSLRKQPQVATNLLLEKEDSSVIFQNIVGRSKPMQKVFRKIRQAASSDIPVLIQGETGTGKDLVAQAIHKESIRQTEPFIPINLGALPSELIGSELFGHEKGAFTGAFKKHIGCFERAMGGTIFLDELGVIDEKLQVSLLRLIEQKKIRRLGGQRNISIDVRLIAATNEDLFENVKQGIFREDLFYRLDVFRISLPPLKDRVGDIKLLANAFLNQFNNLYNKNIRDFQAECFHLMELYDWPGNVRELKNAIQHSVLVCDETYIKPEHMPVRFNKYLKNKDITFTVGTTISSVEREMIIHTLNAVKNNRKKAAQILGISRRSLYNKIHKYHIG